MPFLIVFWAILVALVYADLTPKTQQQYVEEREACFAESKLSEHCIHMIKMGQFPDDDGCYFRCMGLKAGIWDDTNGFNNDRAYDALTAAGYKMEKANFIQCNSADKKNADACRWSADVTKCMWDNKYIKRKS